LLSSTQLDFEKKYLENIKKKLKKEDGSAQVVKEKIKEKPQKNEKVVGGITLVSNLKRKREEK
jgi:hypothetical protein